MAKIRRENDEQTVRMTLDKEKNPKREFLKFVAAGAVLSLTPVIDVLAASRDAPRRRDLMPYEDYQINVFREKYLRPVLDENLFKGKHPIPEINRRFSELMILINKKCGDEIYWNTRKSMTYCKCGVLGVDGCEFYPAPLSQAAR